LRRSFEKIAGQSQRPIRYELSALQKAGLLVFFFANLQPVRSQGSPPSVNEIDPASVGPLRPLPEFFKAYDTVTLRLEIIYDVDRHGMRLVLAEKVEKCQYLGPCPHATDESLKRLGILHSGQRSRRSSTWR
jgi:hypothetical protein